MKAMLRAVLMLVAFAPGPFAYAQSFPSKPLRIVVAFPAGGPLDLVARMLSPKLGEILGQQVLVDNRGGANGIIGTDFVAKSAPDGYIMILASPSAITISPHVYPKMPYDTLRDLQTVTLVTSTPELFVTHPSLPVKTMKDLVALAKSRPGQINVASTGSGGLPHLALELLKNEAKIDLVHVPFNGAAPAVANLIGGQVQGLFADLPVLLPHVQGGKLRAVGIASPKRSPLLPDLATMTEQGLPRVEAVNWYGILVTAKTPREVVMKLNDAFAKTLNDPELKQKLVARGAEPIPGTPEQFAAFLKADYDKWGPIARASGAKID